MGRVKGDQSEMPLPTGAKYLVYTQFLLRFSTKGTQVVLVLFLYEHLRLSENLSTELVHIFLTIMNFGPVLGALLSDGYLGKYRALLCCLLVHLIGMLILVLGAGPSAETGWRIMLVSVSAVGLLLIAVSVGGMKPCISAFGGDQVEESVPQEEDRDRLRALFFSLWYVALNAGSFLATIAIPTLRAFGSYGLIFSVQTAVLGVCVLVFWLGRGHYAHRPVTENVFVKVGTIVVDALRFPISTSARQNANGNSIRGEREHLLSEDEIVNYDRQDVTPGDAKFHWLDGAKLKHDDTAVEDVKLLFRLLVLFTPLPIFWALFEQQYTKWVFQARSMNREVPWLGALVLQPEVIQGLNPVIVLVIIPLLDQVIYPFFTKLNISFPPLRKMVIGIASAAVAFLASGVLQLAMDSTLTGISTVQTPSNIGTTAGTTSAGSEFFLRALPRNASETATSVLILQVSSTPAKLSVFWQVPQYVFITLGEVLINVTCIEFTYSQAPASMKSLLQGSYNCTQAIGDLMTAMIILAVGERLSKANEFFLFAGGCAAAMLVMIWITHGYDDCQRIVPSNVDPLHAETTYISMND